MVQPIQIDKLTLHEVEQIFNMQEVNSPLFFREWQGELPALQDGERQQLDRVREDFRYLAKHPLREEMVKLAVLSPLLSHAGMFRAPFLPQTEHQIEVAVSDGEELVRGRIDLLVLHEKLWVTVIEAKQPNISVLKALPQALFYMMSSPNLDKPSFGLVMNGIEFLFLKVLQQPSPQYALSEPFSLLRHDNDLYTIVGILRRLGTLVTQAEVA